MSNILAYAGCILRFDTNENGYVQIDIFAYESSTERFTNAIDKPLIPSTTMKSTQCSIVGSSLTGKGLLVLLHLITSNSSALMFLQLQSRPWSCHILYTLSIQGSPRFLATDASMSIFVDEEKNPNGFYLIDNQQQKCQRKIEFIPCPLLTYIYCYSKDGYYWLMGSEIETNTNEKKIKVYYGSSTSLSTPLVCFNTEKLIPISHIDNIEDLHILNHQIQLKTRSMVGDLILLSKDHRIFACHHGTIAHELTLNTFVNAILSYQTIENDQLFLFANKDLHSVEIYQYDENFTLTPFTSSHETADLVLIDDFTQIGWKQILFLKNAPDFNSFVLTDFSQIHVFRHDADYDYHAEEKHLSMDMDDTDVCHSLAVVQDILRKKIINADYLVNEGYFQCKQIENDIRKITNQNHIPHLQLTTQGDNLLSNSKASPVQVTETNWFVYRTNFFLYITVKNISNTALSSVHLFGIDKQSNKAKVLDLKPALQTLSREQAIFSLDPNASLMFILTTPIELDKNIDLELYLLINDTSKLFRLSPVMVSIDDLIQPNNERILRMSALEMEPPSHLMYRQAFVYFRTLSRLETSLQSTSKFDLVEHFRSLLAHLGFKQILTMPNVYIRVNQGNIFEHALIELANEDDLTTDDLTVHFYAETQYYRRAVFYVIPIDQHYNQNCQFVVHASEAKLLAKYVLSKLDFQSFTLLHVTYSPRLQPNHTLPDRLRAELGSCLETFKQVPTIMRKTTPTSKSEAYRLLKSENFHSFRHERRLTDLLLATLIID